MAAPKRPLSIRVRYFFCTAKGCGATLGYLQDSGIEKIRYGDEGAGYSEIFPGSVLECACGVEYRIPESRGLR